MGKKHDSQYANFGWLHKSPEYFQINSADNSENYRHKNHYPFNLT